MNSKLFSPIGAAFLFLSGALHAAIHIQAEVTASDSTSSTVKFTFSGSLSDVTPVPSGQLQQFLFIDFNTSPNLVAAGLSLSGDYSAFTSNNVKTSSGATLTTVELRDQTDYYDRLSFIFTTSFSTTTSFTTGSTAEIVLPTKTPLSSSDFDGLSVYWGFPATWGTNGGYGALAGTVSAVTAVSTPPSIGVARDNSGHVIIQFTGVLQSAASLSAAFTPVAGATSPYTVPAGSPSSLYFRASSN